MKKARVLAATLLLGLAAVATAGGEEEELGRDVRPLLAILDSRIERFSLRADLRVGPPDRSESIRIRYSRTGPGTFDLTVEHERYGFRLLREATETTLELPRHGVAFRGSGATDGRDHLDPRGSLLRLVSERSLLRGDVRLAGDLYAAANVNPALAGRLLIEVAGIRRGEGPGRWVLPGGGDLVLGDGELHLRLPEAEAAIRIRRGSPSTDPLTEGLEVVDLPRAELERVVARGVRRALEVLLPAGGRPPVREVEVDNGRTISVDGQRTVLLWGTPEEIGTAHGKLLREEALLCIDSTVRMTGLAYTMEKGRWFLSDLRAAHERLAPFIPEAHRREMDALADALGVDRETVRVANVFPELFHCSGFAVFGSATADGKLYHGRVLDYMTEIGLQDCAAVFVVAPEGRRRFVNVGYAGFTGSVSGMNEAGISLGEMGGRGEGDWDGIPMATLMRRALEECGDLDEVLALFEAGPRTCEYYYVFADGKIPDAVGVAATPETFEVIRAGEGHARLGEGIPDAVVLSAGGRLERLRDRVTGSHGRIDAARARWLMSRPVAMRSNLHNVLFVPEDLLLHVAQAGRDRPAAEMPYVRIDLAALLRRLPAR